jgi:TRAP-type mannitol/chloroaromatic compound transport system substrate-binding protein
MGSLMKSNLTRQVLMVALIGLLVACSGNGENSNSDEAVGSDKQKQQTFHWRMVTTWPKNLPGLGIAPELLAKRVETMSAGRLKITVYGANEIVPAMGVFDAVSLGNVEMGHGAAYYWKGKVPIAQLFTTVPFGLTAQEMNGWLYQGGGLELWEELYAQYDLVPTPAGNTGVQMAGWFNKELNSMEDLRGIKMRIPGLGGEVFQRAGGTAVTLPGGEIFTSLQTGVIDATEWVGPYNDLAFGLHQVAKYYYYPGWQEPGPALETIINMKAFESLPDDLKEIVRSASRVTNEDMLAFYTAKNNSALEELVNVHNVEVRKIPDEVLRELKKISDQVVSELPGDDPLAKRIYASYIKFKTGVESYHELSERAYINARAELK